MFCSPDSCARIKKRPSPQGGKAHDISSSFDSTTQCSEEDSTAICGLSRHDPRSLLLSAPTTCRIRKLEIARQLVNELSFLEATGEGLWGIAASSSAPSPSSIKSIGFSGDIRIPDILDDFHHSFEKRRLRRRSNVHVEESSEGPPGAKHKSREGRQRRMRFRRHWEQRRQQQQRERRQSEHVSSKKSHKQQRQKPIWRTAVDPESGKTYYYDILTRKTQWEKPAEVKAAESRYKAEREKEHMLQFFRDMERNIYRSLAKGQLIPGISPAEGVSYGSPKSVTPHMLAVPHSPTSPTGEEVENCNRTNSLERISGETENFEGRGAQATNGYNDKKHPSPEHSDEHSINLENERAHVHVRTISKMDDVLLAELTQREQKTSRVAIVTTSEPCHFSEESSLSALNTPPIFAGRKNMCTLPPPAEPDTRRTQSNKLPRFYSNLRQLGMSFSERPARSQSAESCVSIQPTNEKISRTLSRSHIRRNTGGTIYVGSTMSSPDIDATIRCVCGAYRAHMLQETPESTCQSPVSIRQFDECIEVFQDDLEQANHSRSSVLIRISEVSSNLSPTSPSSSTSADALGKVNGCVPKLEEIYDFFRAFYEKSKMEHNTIIMSLIYVERLVKETNGCIRPNRRNWKSILFSSMVLASKVWDDLSMWNIDFSRVCRGGSKDKSPLSQFTLRRINKLEVAFLKGLNFNVKVPASEYAKYYFLIRSMLMKSGLLGELAGGGDGVASLKPLDMNRAKELEALSSKYQDAVKSATDTFSSKQRSKSLDNYEWLPADVREQVLPTHTEKRSSPVKKEQKTNQSSILTTPASGKSVCLEQMVQM